MSLLSHSDEMLHRVLREADRPVALDIGANTGKYTSLLLRCGWEVWAFEPVPDVLEKLVANVGSNPKVHILNCGISDRVDFIPNVSVQSCWTLVPDGSGLERAAEYVGKPPFTLHCTTIDTICNAPEKVAPGFIKLDVDGYEFKALRGGVQTLLKHRPPILCEFNCYINKLGQSPEEFVRFITETLNYRVVSMDGKVEMRTWEEIAPHWPYHSSYDVMLLPN